MMWKTPVAQRITRRDMCDNVTNETAPGKCANTAEGLTTNDLLGVEMAAADVTPTGSLAARLDGCPTACGNAELPFGAYQPPSGGLVGLYKCTTCGHRWHVSWREATA